MLFRRRGYFGTSPCDGSYTFCYSNLMTLLWGSLQEGPTDVRDLLRTLLPLYATCALSPSHQLHPLSPSSLGEP